MLVSLFPDMTSQCAMTPDVEKAYRSLLKTLKDSLAEDCWQGSLFFKNVREQLSSMQQQLEHALEGQTKAPQASSAGQMPHHEGLCVYVSLYQSDGKNLKKWAALLRNLRQLGVGRPIYEEEQALVSVIRGKPDMRQDAYVCLRVSEEDVVEPPKKRKPTDRFGNQLLMLDEKALRPERIAFFVHDGIRYLFQAGELTLVE